MISTVYFSDKYVNIRTRICTQYSSFILQNMSGLQICNFATQVKATVNISGQERVNSDEDNDTIMTDLQVSFNDKSLDQKMSLDLDLNHINKHDCIGIKEDKEKSVINISSEDDGNLFSHQGSSIPTLGLKHHKHRLCKIIVTRVKVHFMDVY